jgi:hypothetical protein
MQPMGNLENSAVLERHTNSFLRQKISGRNHAPLFRQVTSNGQNHETAILIAKARLKPE